MSKNKIQKRRRITAFATGIAMVVATAASLGAATYAWFTRGTTAAATGFDFTASAAFGMQISTDAENWRTNITASDIDASLLGQEGTQLEPTTADKLMDPSSTNAVPSAGELTFYSAAVAEGDYVVAADTKNHLRFNLYFDNTGTTAIILKLDELSKITAGDTARGTENSARVAFLNQGAEVSSELEDIRALSEASMASDVYVWEPNSITRSSIATNMGATASAKYAYEGVIAAGTHEPDAFGKIASDVAITQAVTTHDLKLGDSNVITTLPAGKVTKLTVYIWMEGQDIDNDNSVSAGDVKIDFHFDGAEEGTEVDEITATGLTALGVLTTTGTPTLGATYTAYVLENGTTTKVADTYNFVRLVNSGQILPVEEEGDDLIPVVAGTYRVVIFGNYLGSESSYTTAAAIVVA